MTNPLRKYVHKHHNRWVVQKHIEGKLKTFKSFKTLDEALEYRDKLIQNNWEEIPLTPEEEEYKKTREYYKHISMNNNRNAYCIRSRYKSKYLGTVKTIEEALYYRDLYSDCPLPVPKPDEVDLTTDNPYLIEGLMYPLLETLTKQERNTKYGKGWIERRSISSYRVIHNGTSYAACRTYEQAYYVRQELQKCNWDKNEVPRILEDYPKWYTWLLFFYQHIGKIKDNNGEWTGKWKVVFPKRYCDKNLEYIRYSNLEDALFERDYLKEHNWDYGLLVELINDDDNPYYEMELPPYPQRKIRNLRDRYDYVKELNNLRDLILEGYDRKYEVAEIIGYNEVSIRNWLNRYNTNWNDFVNLVKSGEDIWSVLELKEHYFTPDLSPSKPSNYNGYVQRIHSNRSPYAVIRKGKYYGSYKNEITARKVVEELHKVDWDKTELPRIQKEVGYKPFLNTKRWVYEANNGNSWVIRKKNNERIMVNYGSYKDKRVAEMVRDLLIENNWDKQRLDEFRNIAESYYASEGGK